MPQIAIATAHMYPDLNPDDLPLVPALEHLGIAATTCLWNDPALDWTAFDAVLIRSIWDYFECYPQFLGWLDTLDASGIPTINGTGLLRWNSDKRYLTELATAGVPTIASVSCTWAELPAVVAARGGDVVVKPTVSGGAWHTIRGTAGDAGFTAALAALPRDFTYLVQPFVPEVASAGEWSVLFFDGVYSHAVRKVPATGDYRVQVQFGGVSEAEEPEPWLIDAARATLAAASALGFADQAYARVDGVVIDGQFRLMELEMVEPFLWLEIAPAAVDLLAQAVARRVKPVVS